MQLSNDKSHDIYVSADWLKNSVVDFTSHASFGSQTPAVEMNGNDNGCLFLGIIDSMGVPMCQIIIYLLTKM